MNTSEEFSTERFSIYYLMREIIDSKIRIERKCGVGEIWTHDRRVSPTCISAPTGHHQTSKLQWVIDVLSDWGQKD